MALTQVSTGGVKDGSLLNADINASAAISKSKIENLINNNADNRIITGSGTANTLNAESNVVIDSSGNVGIGTSSPAKTLDIVGGEMRVQSNIAGSHFNLRLKGQDTNTGGAIIAENSAGNAGPLLFFSGGSNQAMTIDTSGNVGIGTTIQDHLLHVKGSSAVLKIDHTSSGDTIGVVMRHARGGLSGFSGKMISFIGNDNTEEGSIVIGTTTTAFNTSSDYRLKENEVAISDGITKLKTLKPYTFNFKKDPDVKVDGFFAHEVSAVVPIAVTGTKDEVDADNNPVYQGIDQSKLVPLLTAALQEAVAKIEVLENKVAALEAA